MKILITGSSGFVGTNLVKILSSKHQIVRYDIKEGQDILDEKLLSKKLRGVDLVIHLAAFISAQESWEKPEEYIKNNSLGTLSVVRSSIKADVKKIIFFSSAAVKAKPLTPYAVSKISAEDILGLYKKNINVVVVRPENIYGPGQKEAYGYVIHNFIKAVKNREPIKIYGDGNQTRDFIYIDDVINTVGKIIDMDIKSGTVISLGTGKETRIIDLAKMVMKILGRKIRINFLEQRSEPRKSVANAKKLREISIDNNNFIELKFGVAKLVKLQYNR